MKISINSTFSYIKFNLNYGSALQCYALAEYLKKRGHKPEHLRDYRANPVFIIKRLKNIRYFRGFFKKAGAMHQMQKFIKKYISLSKRGYLSDRALKKHPPQVDCYIAGSDQIWHNANNFRYLTYAPDNSLKLSYAASFGKAEISDDMKNTIKPYLKRFDGISVREKSGVDIIESMGLSASWVIDPTLLLDYEQYPYKKTDKSNYFYCYFLNIHEKDDVHFSVIQNTAEKVGKNLFVTAPLNYMLFSDDNTLFPSVEEWLGLYKDADCIFTNTYHGLLFCIIFKKQFIFFTQNRGQKKENERFNSLLSLLCLQDRMVTGENCEEKINALLEKEIDYNKVYEIIAHKREETDAFFESFNI